MEEPQPSAAAVDQPMAAAEVADNVADAKSDPLAEWEGEPLLERDDLLYVLNLTNTTDLPLKYRIAFRESEAMQANLVFPSEGLVG